MKIRKWKNYYHAHNSKRSMESYKLHSAYIRILLYFHEIEEKIKGNTRLWKTQHPCNISTNWKDKTLQRKDKLTLYIDLYGDMKTTKTYAEYGSLFFIQLIRFLHTSVSHIQYVLLFNSFLSLQDQQVSLNYLSSMFLTKSFLSK